MILLEELARNGAKIATGGDVYDLVERVFDSAKTIQTWELDTQAESAAARELARTNPDALLPVISALQTHFIANKRYPRTYEAIIFALRRVVADGLAGLFEQRPVESEPMRVVLMVPWLAQNPNNNILRVVAGYLAGLERTPGIAGIDLLVTNENAVSAGSHAPGRRLDATVGREQHLGAFRESGVERAGIHYAPPPFEGDGSAFWVREFFDKTRPNVIFVPNVEMTSYYIHGIGKQAASVYLQTSLNNRPPYDFDRYLYLGARRQIDDSHVHPDRWHFHHFGYDCFGQHGDFGRERLGVGDDDIVIVTAGNRLERELTDEIGGIVANTLRENPRAKWMLLGVQDEAAIRRNLAGALGNLGDRVVCHGYVQAIGRYLELSDIYVNPRRTGGAVSMALSVFGNTPVLSFPVNDACNFLLPEMVCETPSAYGARLSQLAGDSAALAAIAHRQREVFLQHHSVEASARDLTEHFAAALSARAGH